MNTSLLDGLLVSIVFLKLSPKLLNWMTLLLYFGYDVLGSFGLTSRLASLSLLSSSLMCDDRFGLIIINSVYLSFSLPF